MTDGAEVTICIASWNTVAATELAVRSAMRLAGAPCEIIVGDGGSTDGTRVMLHRLRREYGDMLQLDFVEGGRTHGEWLDHWTAHKDSKFLIFVDSDMRFRRYGWLRTLLETGREADLVTCEFFQEREDYFDPEKERVFRLAERPAPWLMLIRREPIAATGESFAFRLVERDDLREGAVAFDVGSAVYAAAKARGLRLVVLPDEYQLAFHHYGGLSWRAGMSVRQLRRSGQVIMLPVMLMIERAHSRF